MRVFRFAPLAVFAVPSTLPDISISMECFRLAANMENRTSKRANFHGFLSAASRRFAFPFNHFAVASIEQWQIHFQFRCWFAVRKKLFTFGTGLCVGVLCLLLFLRRVLTSSLTETVCFAGIKRFCVMFFEWADMIFLVTANERPIQRPSPWKHLWKLTLCEHK